MTGEGSVGERITITALAQLVGVSRKRVTSAFERGEVPLSCLAESGNGRVITNAAEAERGYHLSALYSPLGWLSWRQVRDDFVAAKREKDVSRLKTWVNTVLGECWAERGEAPEWARLYARREPYELNRVPKDGLVLNP